MALPWPPEHGTMLVDVTSLKLLVTSRDSGNCKMADKTVNGVPVEAILKPYEDDPAGVQKIPGTNDANKTKLDIVDPDPRWPEFFQLFKSRILAAFEAAHEKGDGDKVTVVSINHVGSTSVPGLPAKAVIDIDLVLSSNDLASEPFYVPCLEAAGFEFRLREPGWHEHRFFRTFEPITCHLHVWGPRSPEVERHRIFRDWLQAHEDDKELYAKIKRESSAASMQKGEAMLDYNLRKQWVLREILMRAFKGLGLLEQDGK